MARLVTCPHVSIDGTRHLPRTRVLFGVYGKHVEELPAKKKGCWALSLGSFIPSSWERTMVTSRVDITRSYNPLDRSSSPFVERSVYQTQLPFACTLSLSTFHVSYQFTLCRDRVRLTVKIVQIGVFVKSGRRSHKLGSRCICLICIQRFSSVYQSQDTYLQRVKSRP